MALVRTPAPQRTESLLGYIQRVAEANGYRSRQDVLATSGISREAGIIEICMNIDKLAAVVSRPAGDLLPLSYVSPGREKDEWVILGKQTIPRHIRLTRQALCPRCVEERGFIEALWDSATVIACPRHRCGLVASCPACGRALGGTRPGLLECGCGASLSQGQPPPVAEEVAVLMAVLAHKIVGDPAPAGCVLGIPVDHLAQMSLRSLQRIIFSLGYYEKISRSPNETLKKTLFVEEAARVLSDWPENFYSVLKRIGDLNAIRKPTEGSFTARHNRIRKIVSKRGHMEETEAGFIRDAVMRYGMEKWEEGLVRFRYPGAAYANFDRKFLSRSEIASHLGVSVCTVSKLEAEKRFSITRQRRGSLSVILVEKNKIPLPAAKPGRTLGERQASCFLGLSVALLRGLRSTGIFKPLQLATPRTAYHIEDLKAFSDKLTNSALTCKGKGFQERGSGRPLISLKRILINWTYFPIEGRVELIQAILDGRIQPAGSESTQPGGLLFDPDDVLPIAERSRGRQVEGTLTALETAKHLSCDPGVVASLIDMGYLSASRNRRVERVESASVEAFSNEYVSIARMAKQCAITSPRALAEICEHNGLPLLYVTRKYCASPQPFLPRKHEGALKMLAMKHHHR